MRFGVHVSIAGGLDKGLLRAVKIGCDTAQIFLVNPRAWKAKPLQDEEVERFKKVRNNQAKHIAPLVAHMPYLPNLAAQNGENFEKSIASLRDNLERCDALGINFLVMHMGKGEREFGIKHMREGILRAFDEKSYNTCLLIENTAGQGKELGSKVSEIAELYSKLPDSISKGICLDTCHAFAAGYDLRRIPGINHLIDEFEKYIGFKEVKVIHLNDSMKEFNKRIDRHAVVGEGYIGNDGFKRIFKNKAFKSLPFIMEVPRNSEKDDIAHLKYVKLLAGIKRK